MRMIALVGSNPLPIYLAARALRAEQIVAVHTKESLKRAEALREVLGDQVELRPLTDHTSAQHIRADLRALHPDGDTHLHYTGGTKFMVVQAELAYSEDEIPPGRRSYLDDQTRTLRFDDGTSLALGDDELDVEEVLRLHGWDPGTAPRGSDAVIADLDVLASKCIADLDDGAKLHDIWRSYFRPEGKLVKKTAKLDGDLDLSGLGLIHDHIGPQSRIPNHQTEYIGRVLTGDWLEYWVGELLVQQFGAAVRVSLEQTNPQWELDVVTGAGGRLRVVSCTTDAELGPVKGLVKGKAFEVAFRSRQFGDQTRTAVVSALRPLRVQKLRATLRPGWEAPTEPRVFGIDDLRSWIGGDPTSLHDWWDRTR